MTVPTGVDTPPDESVDPNGPAGSGETGFAAAVAWFRAGDAVAAEAACRDILAADGAHAGALSLLGVLALRRGAAVEAVAVLVRAAAAAPARADVWTNLGAAYRVAGRPEAALDALRRAVSLDPDSVDARYNLANALAAAGTLEEAVAIYRDILDAAPRSGGVLINLGAALRQLGDSAAAAATFSRAADIEGFAAAARGNLGVLAVEDGLLSEGLAHYRSALGSDPNSPEILNNFGVALLRAGRDEEAEAALRAALAVAPDLPDAQANLANVLRRKGDVEAAAAAYRASLARRPSDGVRLRLATLLPVIAPSLSAQRAAREDMARSVDAFRDVPLRVADPLAEIGATNFLLSYHEENNRELSAAVARLYRRACPGLTYTAAHCTGRPRPSASQTLRVGFVSEFFRTHAVGWFYHRILRTLPRDGLEVTAFTFSREPDPLWSAIAADVDHAVVLPANLAAARAGIAAAALDAVVFTDIGMAPLTYFLAFSRLAPLQCVYHGHPDTTGLSTFDYYLSCAAAEPPGAGANYVEPLVGLKGCVTRYDRPPPPAGHASRSTFGLREDANLYLCPQSLFKIHPDMDPVLRDILRRDPQGELVLVQGPHREWAERLLDRWRPLFGAAMGRVHVLARMPHNDFMNLMRLCDVMLDTWPHGGSNTSYQAFSLGVPVVTSTAKFARGRYTATHYRQMGVDGPVAATPEAYVQNALALGRNPDRRAALSAAIGTRAGRLFDDAEVVDDLARFLRVAATRDGNVDRWLLPG